MKYTHTIASFDIGYRNFSVYVEKIPIKKLREVKLPPKNLRYKPDGTLNETMKQSVNEVYQTGEQLLHINTDLTDGVKGEIDMTKVSRAMTTFLDAYRDVWKKLDIVLVEHQMNFGKMKNNVKATRLSHHCMSYFLIKYPSCNVIEYPAYHKTQLLGCHKIKGKRGYKALKKIDRKKWSVEEALRLYEVRGDEDALNFIRKSKKKDDLADTLLQLQSYKIGWYVD